MSDSDPETIEHAIKNVPILRRRFPSAGSICVDVSECGVHKAVVDALRIAQRGVNEALAEPGVFHVDLQYYNVPDVEFNPDGNIGAIHVIAYRVGQPGPNLPATAQES